MQIDAGIYTHGTQNTYCHCVYTYGIFWLPEDSWTKGRFQGASPITNQILKKVNVKKKLIANLILYKSDMEDQTVLIRHIKQMIKHDKMCIQLKK